MLGYLMNVELGASLYNLVHTETLPLLVAGISFARHEQGALAFSLIWIAHIGFDRAPRLRTEISDLFQGHPHAARRSILAEVASSYSVGMPSKIASRIEKDSGVAGLFDALALKLPSSDLQSLLLEVYRTRAEGLSEPALLAQASRNPLLAASAVNARQFAEFDCAAFDAAKPISLRSIFTPACPFGASYTLGGTSQNNVLTTIRNAEAFERSGAICDGIRSRPPQTARRGFVIRLCAEPPRNPVAAVRCLPWIHAAHFRLFAMVSAGRVAASRGFEIDELCRHCAAYLRLFRKLNRMGFSISDPLVEFT